MRYGRGEQRRGPAAGDGLGEVAERRRAGHSPAERERSVEIAEPGALPGRGHAHGTAERSAVAGSVHPDAGRWRRVRVHLAHAEFALVPGQGGLLGPGEARGRGARQDDPLEVAAPRAAGNLAGEERPRDPLPGRVMQVDDCVRHALGAQLLADGLDPRRAVGHHEHVKVHATVRRGRR